MTSSKGNYHRRGPYFHGTNFATWKHKMKMHMLGFNPHVCAVMRVGVQGNFFEEGHELDRDATPHELKMFPLNAQACDIIFNYL